jgi:hypothetical protein
VAAAAPAPARAPQALPASAPELAEAAAVQLSLREFMRDVALETEAREQAERRALTHPPGSENATIDQRLELYKQALEKRTEGLDPARVLPYRSVLTEVFLRIEDVQRELATLQPADRAQQIARIRRELGYGDAEIERLAREDEVKEGRWQTGLAYMEERRRVAATFEGEALAQELAALRTRYFAGTALTIEREEASGFFRFERPRVYGRN